MKKQLRLKMKELRAALSPQQRREAALLCLEQLKSMPEFQKAGVLFCYVSVGDELPTAEISAAHPRVAFPKVFPDGEMRFYLGGTLKSGFRGIPEPQGGRELLPREGDLMLLPGLAFGRDGSRLGYGGGYYDRYLARCTVRPLCCGICYPGQVMEAVPSEAHDVSMDLLVFGRKMLDFRSF